MNDNSGMTLTTNLQYGKSKPEIAIILAIFFLMATTTLTVPPVESDETKSNSSLLEFSTDQEYFSWFDVFKSVADEFGVFPIEFLNYGLQFTLLMPSIDEMLALISQIVNRQDLDFAYEFERILFGYLTPGNLTSKVYVRTFPGTKFYLKNITDNVVQVGRFLVDISKFTTISNYIMIYYVTSPEPK